MQRLATWAVAVLVVSSQAITFSQSRTPTSSTHISKADIEAVLTHVGSEGGGTDRQIKVVDMGQYNVGVGVIHRGPTRPGAPVTGIGHSQVTEVYYVLSGAGTFISGGPVLNRKEQSADSEIVRVAVGPSFGGTFQGGDTRAVSAGDVIIIPPGVMHGFTEIRDEVTYLMVRPDGNHVLPSGYVHPALRK